MKICSGLRGYLTLLAVCVSGYSTAQSVVKGRTNAFANVQIIELQKGVQANEIGDYQLEVNRLGRFTIVISAVGFETYKKEINLQYNQVIVIDHKLTAVSRELQEVQITVKSEAQEIREKGIKADVISTNKIQNEAVTLNEIINRTAGIRVRQVGGLGSAANVLINGFQGKAVKYFKDGVPMDYLGAGFNINTVPVNLLDRVEIYKGVLPTQLSADALGGAINLVSRSNTKKYLDLSYEAASFNTHRISLNSYYQHPRKGWFIGLDGFYNHSDNNYRVTVKVIDAFTRTRKDAEITRFHDAFSNLYGEVSMGVTDRKWADLLRFSLAYFEVDKEEQHGALMTEPFGQVTSRQTSFVPTLRYKKTIGSKWIIDQFLVLNTIIAKRVDTCHCVYDWYGNRLASDARQGESDADGSLSNVNFTNFTSRTYLSYQATPIHKIDLNVTYTTYDRLGADPFGNKYIYSGRDILAVPAGYKKAVLSAGIESAFSRRLTNNFIIKYFGFTTYGTDALYASASENQTRNQGNRFGLAEALKQTITEHSFVRLSAELATRLPENTEVFGDGLFEMSNFSIKPEKSLNINLGYRLQKIQRYSLDVNMFYRRATDIIVQVPANVIFLQHQNVDKVKGFGVEADGSIQLNKWLKTTANITYQSLRLFGITDPNVKFLEGSRVRNTPYFFGGANLHTNHQNIFRTGDTFQAYWYYNYVNEFYLEPIPRSKEAKGFLGIGSKANINSELVIPAQHLHSAGMNYSIRNDKASLGLEVKNVFNAQLYDNFRVQRAGRSVHVKLRFSII